jgi:hypothetical protein
MKLRWTLLLLAINLILMGLFVRQCSHPASMRAFEQLSRNFLPIEGESWDGVEIARGDGDWRVNRDRWGQWWLKSPIEWPARSDRMARLMGCLLSLKVESSFSAADLKRVGQNLHSYGLDVPRAELTVSNSNRTLRYKIGSITPLGGKLYVLSPDGEEIWVVDGALDEYISWTFDQLHQDRFFPFEVAELMGIDLETPSQKMSFDRSDAGGWIWKVGELPTPLKKGALDRFVAQLGGLKVSEFEKLSADAQGLRLPYGRLAFRMLYGRRVLLLGAPAGDDSRWAQWEGSKTVFKLPQAILDSLNAVNLLPDMPFDFDSTAVTSLEVRLPSGNWSADRDDAGNWSSAGESLDPEQVQKYLLSILAIQGSPRLGGVSVADYPYSIGVHSPQGGMTLSVRDGLSEGAMGGILYRFETPLADLPLAELRDRHFLPVFAPDSLLANLKDTASGTLIPISREAPEFAALQTLLKDPRVAQWDDAAPVSFEKELDLSDDNSSVQLRLSRGEKGAWHGQTGQKNFQFTPEWGALLDALCQVRPQ